MWWWWGRWVLGGIVKDGEDERGERSGWIVYVFML